MEELGKMLLLIGVLSIILGIAFFLIGKVPLLGRLPGDISIQRENFSCFFPLATSILLSIVLTIILNLILRAMNK